MEFRQYTYFVACICSVCVAEETADILIIILPSHFGRVSIHNRPLCMGAGSYISLARNGLDEWNLHFPPSAPLFNPSPFAESYFYSCFHVPVRRKCPILAISFNLLHRAVTASEGPPHPRTPVPAEPPKITGTISHSFPFHWCYRISLKSLWQVVPQLSRTNPRHGQLWSFEVTFIPPTPSFFCFC